MFLSDRRSKTPESLDLPTIGSASSDRASCRIFIFCARRAYCLVLRRSIRVALEVSVDRSLASVLIMNDELFSPYCP